MTLEQTMRLMLAAPEMLEALKEADRLYSTVFNEAMRPGHYGLIANHEDCGRWIGTVRDAISKATGSTT